MVDTRFPDPVTDARFETLGVDVRFSAFPIDQRFPELGLDTRFMADGPGGWAIDGLLIEEAPYIADPSVPTLIGTTVYGSAGVYRITNITLEPDVVTEIYLVPPFDLQDYGSPGDELNVVLLSFSPAGPTLLLPDAGPIEFSADFANDFA